MLKIQAAEVSGVSVLSQSERFVLFRSPRLKEAFKHVLIDGRGGEQAPRVDMWKALCFFL